LEQNIDWSATSDTAKTKFLISKLTMMLKTQPSGWEDKSTDIAAEIEELIRGHDLNDPDWLEIQVDVSGIRSAIAAEVHDNGARLRWAWKGYSGAQQLNKIRPGSSSLVKLSRAHQSMNSALMASFSKVEGKEETARILSLIDFHAKGAVVASVEAGELDSSGLINLSATLHVFKEPVNSGAAILVATAIRRRSGDDALIGVPYVDGDIDSLLESESTIAQGREYVASLSPDFVPLFDEEVQRRQELE
jgi:hypothetical protein